ncbi:MAG TPA: hypothetical protein PLX16_08600 [Exilispira sp.]|nr:hypothetical protein [Exilispira sp.]
MDDTIVINAGLSEVDKDLVRYLFKLKASTLEHAEEPVGTFSVARRIIEAAQRVIDFMDEFSRKDAFFFIFIGAEKEENLKLICNTVLEKSEKTKYFAIKIHDSWLDFSVNQLTLSGKMFTKIK